MFCLFKIQWYKKKNQDSMVENKWSNGENQFVYFHSIKLSTIHHCRIKNWEIRPQNLHSQLNLTKVNWLNHWSKRISFSDFSPFLYFSVLLMTFLCYPKIKFQSMSFEILLQCGHLICLVKEYKCVVWRTAQFCKIN